jgi:hypothetical protein
VFSSLFKFVFYSFFVTCLNKDYSNSWVVDMNSFMVFRLRRMSFNIGFSAPKVEENELPMY